MNENNRYPDKDQPMYKEPAFDGGASAPATKRSSLKWMIAVAGIVLVLAAGIMLFFYIRNMPQTQPEPSASDTSAADYTEPGAVEDGKAAETIYSSGPPEATSETSGSTESSTNSAEHRAESVTPSVPSAAFSQRASAGTEAPSVAETEISSEHSTEAPEPTEAQVQSTEPTEALEPADDPIELPTDIPEHQDETVQPSEDIPAPTEDSSPEPSEAPSEPAAEPAEQPATEPAEPSSEPIAEPSTEQPAEHATEPPTAEQDEFLRFTAFKLDGREIDGRLYCLFTDRNGVLLGDYDPYAFSHTLDYDIVDDWVYCRYLRAEAARLTSWYCYGKVYDRSGVVYITDRFEL